MMTKQGSVNRPNQSSSRLYLQQKVRALARAPAQSQDVFAFCAQLADLAVEAGICCRRPCQLGVYTQTSAPTIPRGAPSLVQLTRSSSTFLLSNVVLIPY